VTTVDPSWTPAVDDRRRPARSIWRVTLEARSIEAVVFDMDGVLVDSEPIWRAGEQEVFAGVGIEVTEEDLLETMGVRVADVVERWHRRHPWDEPSRQEIAETIIERVAEAIVQGGALNEDAVRAVEYIHELGLRIALASSSPMRLIRAVLSLGGLSDRFDVVLTAEDEEEGKPDPAVYVSAARELRVPAERCLAVEDSINGVRSAKAAGMVCVAIPVSGVTEGFEAADLVLDSIEELDDRIWAATGTIPAPVPSDR
jgi:mannitol-1-/sugar-/sorbitol-6-/2-deoxyglucose-6-phosphatase